MKRLTITLLLLASAAHAGDDNTVTIKVDGYSGPLSVSDETCRVDDLVSAAQAMLAMAETPYSVSVLANCDPCTCGSSESECLTYQARIAKRKEDEIAKARETIERCATVLQKAAAAPTTDAAPTPQASASETR
jgi:hypothetical protein